MKLCLLGNTCYIIIPIDLWDDFTKAKWIFKVSVWFDLHKDKNASVTSQYSLVHMTGVTLFSEWKLKKHLNVQMYTFSKFLSNTFHHFLYFTRSCFYYFFYSDLKNIFTKIHHLHRYHISFTKHKSTLKHQPQTY